MWEWANCCGRAKPLWWRELPEAPASTAEVKPRSGSECLVTALATGQRTYGTYAGGKVQFAQVRRTEKILEKLHASLPTGYSPPNRTVNALAYGLYMTGTGRAPPFNQFLEMSSGPERRP